MERMTTNIWLKKPQTWRYIHVYVYVYIYVYIYTSIDTIIDIDRQIGRQVGRQTLITSQKNNKSSDTFLGGHVQPTGGLTAIVVDSQSWGGSEPQRQDWNCSSTYSQSYFSKPGRNGVQIAYHLNWDCRLHTILLLHTIGIFK